MTRRSQFVALAAAALVAGAAGTAAAQPPAGGPPPGGARGMGPGGPGGRGMQALLFEGITLSDAQKVRVDSIQNARRAATRERMAAMQGGTPGGGMADSAAMASFRQQMRTAMEQDRAAMRAVLTADQQKTFDANVARMQERQRQRMQNGGPGGMGGPGAGPDRPAGGRD